MTPDAAPTLAVWKFASCDGCQLSLLDCEDELLALAGAVRIAHFTEMTRAHVDGPYDVSLVEGSITTEEDAERIRAVPRRVPPVDHHRCVCDVWRRPGTAEPHRRG